MLTTEKLMVYFMSERGALSDYIGTISINWDSPRPTSHMKLYVYKSCRPTIIEQTVLSSSHRDH